MKVNEVGKYIDYLERRFTVGEKIIAVGESDYAGLVGTIVEIGRDKQRGVIFPPHLYCDFEPPMSFMLKNNIKEKLVAKGEKSIDLTNLKRVRQEISMVISFSEFQERQIAKDLYVVKSECVINGVKSETKTIYLDYETAITNYEYLLQKERTDGMLTDMERKGYVKEISKNTFEYFKEGGYDEWRFSLGLEVLSANLSEDFFNQIGEEHREEFHRLYIRENVPLFGCMKRLDDEEMQEIIEHPEFAKALEKRFRREPHVSHLYYSIMYELAKKYVAERFPKRLENMDN